MSEKNEEEVWKPIPSKPGYEASSLGRIRSKTQLTPYTRKNMQGKISYYPRKGKILAQVEDGGYLKCHLGWVHRLVGEAFLGPAPEGCTEINHISEDKKDNRPENLEWCDHSYNVMYGEGAKQRIKSQLRRWQIKKLQGLDIAWPKILEIMEVFS